MQKGSIGVTTDNIFPVIKKFLYSDHEIFLRELVSNAVDATQKLKTLAAVGDFKGELGNLNVEVSIDKEAGTLTVSDHGIGMTAEEIEKYMEEKTTIVIMKLSQCTEEVHRCIHLHPEYNYHYFENIGTEKEKYLHDTELISALSFPYFSLLIIRHSTF